MAEQFNFQIYFLRKNDFAAVSKCQQDFKQIII